MTSRPSRSANRRQRLRALAKGLAVRAAFLGGAAALIFLAVADVRSLIPSWPARAPHSEAPQPAAPEDPGWPHRRGPHYDAVSDETDLADSWPPEGPPVLWTLELGRGYSGFIAVGDRVFTQTQSLTGQSVVCLQADTGRQIWRHRYGWPYEPGGMYPGPRATPTWHQGYVYFAGPRGLAGRLRASDGRPVWQVDVNGRYSGRGTDFGYSCSPLVEDGRVVLPVGGKAAGVVALDARDGSTAWASGDEPASYCSALPITLGGRRLVVAFLQNALAIFDLKTGKLLCQEKYSWGYDEHAAAPLYDEPYLMIACPFQSGAECYRIEARDPATDDGGPPGVSLSSVWYSRAMSNDTASCVLLDGHVYGFDIRDVQAKPHRASRGKFKCLELTTGKVLWETGRPGHATVIAADGKLVLFNDTGELLLARISPDGYQELARTEIFSGEICWTAPSLHRGRLYLRSPSKAACVYIGRPENLDQQRRQQARPASEIPKRRRLDLAWMVGGERQYVFDPPDAAELWRWFWYSLLGVLLPALAIAALVHLLVGLRRPAAVGRGAGVVFWCAAFAFGAAGTAVFNRFCDEFIFTWPVCLVVAHQLALNTIVRAAGHTEGQRSRTGPALATLLLIAVCLSYYLLCRRFGMAVQWPFLLGFLPSWPVAVPAAYRLRRRGHPLRDFVCAALSFSVHFWVVGGYLLWKTAAL